MSGVTIASSGQPGEPRQVRIHGINTFGNSNPLYIIDGVPGDISSLNSNDIANIQILKDAGSAPIYRARAANGVIIIITKKGRETLKTIITVFREHSTFLKGMFMHRFSSETCRA